MPANDEDIDLEVERLSGRPQGIIKVHVISAKGLKSFDTLTGGSMVGVVTSDLILHLSLFGLSQMNRY
jgi:hypothetical protein